jgi:hypothetical protein
MALYPKALVSVSFVAFCVCLSTASSAQMSHADPVQVKPPLLRTIDPPSPDATAADLETRADELHGQKLYFDAITIAQPWRKTKLQPIKPRSSIRFAGRNW